MHLREQSRCDSAAAVGRRSRRRPRPGPRRGWWRRGSSRPPTRARRAPESGGRGRRRPGAWRAGAGRSRGSSSPRRARWPARARAARPRGPRRRRPRRASERRASSIRIRRRISAAARSVKVKARIALELDAVEVDRVAVAGDEHPRLAGAGSGLQKTSRSRGVDRRGLLGRRRAAARQRHGGRSRTPVLERRRRVRRWIDAQAELLVARSCGAVLLRLLLLDRRRRARAGRSAGRSTSSGTVRRAGRGRSRPRLHASRALDRELLGARRAPPSKASRRRRRVRATSVDPASRVVLVQAASPGAGRLVARRAGGRGRRSARARELRAASR